MSWHYIAFLGIVLATGIVALLLAMASARRKAREELSAPATPIPGAETLATPAYVPAASTHILARPLSVEDQAVVKDSASAWWCCPATLPAGFDVAVPLVLRDVRVVTVDSIQAEREFYGLLGAVGKHDCLVVAAAVSAEVADALRANWSMGMRRVVPVVCKDAAKVAEAASAPELTRIDLQSGWVPELGSVAVAVVTGSEVRLQTRQVSSIE